MLCYDLSIAFFSGRTSTFHSVSQVFLLQLFLKIIYELQLHVHVTLILL